MAQGLRSPGPQRGLVYSVWGPQECLLTARLCEGRPTEDQLPSEPPLTLHAPSGILLLIFSPIVSHLLPLNKETSLSRFI